MTRFAAITGAMVALLALGLALGGLFAVAALVYITAFTFAMDRIVALQAPDRPGQEFPAGTGLSVALGLVHFPLLYAGVARIAGADGFGVAEKVVLFLALGQFLGQVSNSNAHELIHQGRRALRRLGVAVYGSLLFGHHASAHPRVHHVHAATDRDPNSARLGETYYAFALRAWIGSFREGLRAETDLRRRKGLPMWGHPYPVYVLLAALSIGLGYGIGGAKGAVVLVLLAGYAQMQLLLSDYVQHYGLTRRELDNGRMEPVGPQHSWNAPQGFSSGLMLNAPRHSDHHMRPARPFPGLELDREAMPILPRSLPIMAALALVPPVWRRMMDRRARKWQDTARKTRMTQA